MRKIFSILILLTFDSCSWIGAGTLGAFKGYCFPISEKDFEKELINFYTSNPSYKLPKKWEDINNWEKSGYGSLNGKIFYFEETPEEMYYATFFELVDDYTLLEGQRSVKFSVRAIYNGNGFYKWLTVDDFVESKSEKDRIEKRFHNEVIKKIEKLTNTKAIESN